MWGICTGMGKKWHNISFLHADVWKYFLLIFQHNIFTKTYNDYRESWLWKMRKKWYYLLSYAVGIDNSGMGRIRLTTYLWSHARPQHRSILNISGQCWLATESDNESTVFVHIKNSVMSKYRSLHKGLLHQWNVSI